MPRGISVEALRELVSEETSDIFTFILEIDPKDGSEENAGRRLSKRQHVLRY